MKALIHAGKVWQIVPAGEEFPVAPPMVWIDCDGTVAVGWVYDQPSGLFTAATVPELPSPGPDPQSEFDIAVDGARAAYEAAADQAARDAAFLALCDALTGKSGRAGRASARGL